MFHANHFIGIISLKPQDSSGRQALQSPSYRPGPWASTVLNSLHKEGTYPGFKLLSVDIRLMIYVSNRPGVTES